MALAIDSDSQNSGASGRAPNSPPNIGTIDGHLALVGGGDLTFGGRRVDAETMEVTNFDHTPG
ncbi:MAG: hypothetical protein ACR2HP_11360 [Ilumatobacteraceae bacterium]